MDTIYKENILDHYRNPHNKRHMHDVTFSRKEYNVLCGDEVEFFVRLAADNTIADVSFEGAGCAVSQAAASLLTEQLVGKKKEEVMCMGVKEMQELLGTALGAVRIKCALLSLCAIQEGWRIYQKSEV